MSDGIRVLIVEDELMVGEMIKGVVEEAGLAVTGKAQNGAQAVELAQTIQPDVVLMDIQMPGMDGLEAARRIQQTRPTPVVVLTAHQSPELVSRANAAGVGGYLLKPPAPPDLKRVIAIAIARFDDMMALRRLNAKLDGRNKALEDALAKINVLSGLLPICANCKKIRDDDGYWHQVEVYMEEHSDARFTHGLCPDCKQTLYPQLF